MKIPLFLKDKAFTLLELIICASLMTILFSTLYSFFSRGKTLYFRIEKENEKNSEMEIFSQIFKRDISCLIPWQERYLILSANQLYFHIASLDSENPFPKRIDYELATRYFESTKIFDIKRTEKPILFPSSPGKKTDPKSVTLVHDCKKVQFLLLSKFSSPLKNEDESPPEEKKDSQKPAYTIGWYPEWKFKEFPAAIQIQMKKLDNQEFTCSQWLPQAQFLPFEKVPTLSLSPADLEDMEE
jgi:hypothetical protein